MVWNRNTVVMVPSPKAMPNRYMATPKRRNPSSTSPQRATLTLHPKRLECPSDRLDFSKITQLNFHPPDLDRFPALGLGHEVALRGGTAGAVLNAANEAAVEMFREGAIDFLDIARYTERALTHHEFNGSPTLDDLLAADRWAREEVKRCTTC